MKDKKTLTELATVLFWSMFIGIVGIAIGLGRVISAAKLYRQAVRLLNRTNEL